MNQVDLYGLRYDPNKQYSFGSMSNWGMPQTQDYGANSSLFQAGDKSGIGFNMPTLRFGLDALGSIGGLWNAFNANKVAKDQFSFMKDITNANLNNSISSYNTRLSDLARSRAAIEGQSSQQMQEYIDRNKLTR